MPRTTREVWGGVARCCLVAALQKGIIPRKTKLESCATTHAHAAAEKPQFASLAAVLVAINNGVKISIIKFMQHLHLQKIISHTTEII